ncbi:Rne/Rng family ribonuclease [Arvimicrobium flavum]|uniref:Rne/Rng family ribonuclease n=1 Tax=Arvimicrobium flavum TaxID=3393320 RepID=UPI00237B081B|nr:ribonuclease E/G [Mesorhizobium shangrilense]
MPNKMLIDASHPEETRVIVVRGNRIEEFDFESQDKKQLRGNIYLARVTRVEPSLQAAFVEYGGNRHGFLAFSEIHPDYYQIPVADRQALLKAEAAQARADEDDDEDSDGEERQDRGRGRRKRRGRGRDRNGDAAQAAATEDADSDSSGDASDEIAPIEEFEASETIEASHEETDTDETAETAVSDAADAEAQAEPAESEADGQPATEDGGKSMAAAIEGDVVSEPAAEASNEVEPRSGSVEEVNHASSEENEVESVGAEDALEEVHARRKPLRRQYKIQEVIKRRQILLVQVVKEERGNKGAALTTYLSLAGRYSVLMPNTARGGGISRKITNAQDRKRLKDVVKDLEVPEGMGVILRTAGENRTKAEIKRDYEYLMRLWENVRNLTLQSTAPALVYEEGSLIKRSVRDLYNKDIDEILVSGEEGYREAKDFMRMLMPSHAKVVQPYRDTTPIFARNGIEAQLDRMVQPQVTLKSGGYIIINQTEALVAIDVNSGRSTKEHSIEDTALQTNLEAAEEVARQLRLRDLAGLIVIDFIDMEENRNNRAVEKRLKDHLKNDRARIQVGRISHFGLMEMSRQRIRASVLESTMKPCPHCGGTGHVRSDSSVALLVVRAIEEFLLKDSRNHLIVKTPAATALYVLNHKRSTLSELERRFALTITLDVDETLGAQHYAILKGAIAEKPIDFVEPASLPAPVYDEPEAAEEIEEEVEETAAAEAPSEQHAERHDGAHREDGEHGRDRKRRRRRRRRGGRDRDEHHHDEHDQQPHDDAEHPVAAANDDQPEESAEAADLAAAATGGEVVAEAVSDAERKKRRRGKRGGKRNRREDGTEVSELEAGADSDAEDAADETPEAAEVAVEVAAPVEAAAEEAPAPEAAVEPVAEPVVEAAPEKPKRATRSRKAATPAAADEATAEAKPARKPRASRKKTVEAPAIDAAPAIAAEVESEPAAEPAAPAKQVIESVDAVRPATEPAEAVANLPEATPEAEAAPEGEPKPKKGGWWQRSKSFF